MRGLAGYRAVPTCSVAWPSGWRAVRCVWIVVQKMCVTMVRGSIARECGCLPVLRLAPPRHNRSTTVKAGVRWSRVTPAWVLRAVKTPDTARWREPRAREPHRFARTNATASHGELDRARTITTVMRACYLLVDAVAAASGVSSMVMVSRLRGHRARGHGGAHSVTSVQPRPNKS